MDFVVSKLLIDGKNAKYGRKDQYIFQMGTPSGDIIQENLDIDGNPVPFTLEKYITTRAVSKAGTRYRIYLLMQKISVMLNNFSGFSSSDDEDFQFLTPLNTAKNTSVVTPDKLRRFENLPMEPCNNQSCVTSSNLVGVNQDSTDSSLIGTNEEKEALFNEIKHAYNEGLARDREKY